MDTKVRGERERSQPEDNQQPPPQPRFYKQLRFRIPLTVVGAYIFWCSSLYFLQDQIIFPVDATPKPKQPRPPYSNAETIKLQIENGGKIEACFIPAKYAAPNKPSPVVMFFHGNAEIVDQQRWIINGYQRLGFSVLLPEYRGYGRSSGRPSQKAILSDNLRFYDELLKRNDIDKSRILFHGRSLGGGLAADLVRLRKPAGLILESTFSSVASMSYRYGAPSFLVTNPLRTDRVISDLDFPVLIFHGTHDEIIPVSHGRELRDLATKATYVEYDCGHNDFPGDGNEGAYWQEIKNYLKRCNLIKSYF